MFFLLVITPSTAVLPFYPLLDIVKESVIRSVNTIPMGFMEKHREKHREKVLALIQNDPNRTIVRMAEELSLTPRCIE